MEEQLPRNDLRGLMVQHFGTVKAFAEAAGLPPSTVYSVLNRGIGGASFDVVMKIYDTLQIDWANMEIGGPFKSKLKSVTTQVAPFVDVPLYGSIAAGTPIEMVEVEGEFPVPATVADRYPDAFLLKVEGESMNRVLPNGCYALVDPCMDADRQNAAYAVCVNGYDATIKRVRRLNNGFELVPDSTDPTYKPALYDYGVEGTETITVIGRVVYYVLPFDWEI